jgi:endoglycosylceramidase
MGRRVGLVVLLGGALALSAAPVALSGPTAPLAHVGRFLTDSQGRAVVMHGVNMVYKRPPYDPSAAGFGDDDAAFLRSQGLNTVRVGIIYKGVEPSPGVYDEAYLDRIAQTVDVLARHGIFSMLDFHQDLYNERFFGEGWPDWAVRDDGLPNQPNLGFPGNYLGMASLNRAFDHFWANDPGPGGIGLQDRYAAAWRHVAERFRGRPYVMGYDLLNEPWPGSAYPTCANPAGCPAFDQVLGAFSARTIRAIRQVDPRNLVWYEPNVIFNSGAQTQHPATGDRQAGMSFHLYCLAASSPAGSDPTRGSACDTAEQLVFDNALAHAAKTGDTLMMSEFGAIDDLGLIERQLGKADAAMVSWQHWHYCACDDPTTSGPGSTQAIVVDPKRPPAGDNLKTAKLDTLVRPYPEAVAGTPERFSFDPAAKRFDLSFTTRLPGGAPAGARPTELFVPARQYPGGYRAEIRGAAVTSAPGASELRLVACPGAVRVTVRVTPAGGAAPTPDCTIAEARRRVPAGPTRLRLAVTPRAVLAGRRTRFVFRATTLRAGRARPVSGALVRFAGRLARTNRAGRAVVIVRLVRPGRRVARVSRRGLRDAAASVLVRPAPRGGGGARGD